MADKHDDRCYFPLDGAGMRQMCADMKTLAMLQADGSKAGIPKSTLCSNDGYIVSPVGITQALDAFRAASPEAVESVRQHWRTDDGSNRFDRWIEFLERAAKAGGFQAW